MKPFKEVIDGIRKAVMASEVREDLAQMGEYVEQFANTAGENIQKAIDPTLSLSGKAADAKATGDAIRDVRNDLSSEISRAQTAEKANADGIAAEASRAKGEEQRLDAAITAETTRAEQAEQALSARTDALESCGFVVVDGKVCMKYRKS
jgi:hypothetical protein